MIWRNYDLGSLILGTAQLGFSYGVANLAGKPSLIEANNIIDTAWQEGIRAFDTAQIYGGSETTLGTALRLVDINQEALIITKLPESAFEDQHACTIALNKSLNSLNRTKVFGVLAHSPAVLQLEPKKLKQLFEAITNEGKAQYMGVSVYTAAEALSALKQDVFEIVQMPLNVLDRAAVELGVIDQARESGKLMIFRSTFLQGLLTLEPMNLPQHMSFARNTITEWWHFCTEHAITPVSCAIQIALELADGFPLLMGAERANQVKENIQMACSVHPFRKELLRSSYSIYHNATNKIRNPALWKN